MERVITACSMPFFAKGDFTMGVFSEIVMEQQNSMFDSSAAFEDDEAFELEEMESLPVPPVGTDTVQYRRLRFVPVRLLWLMQRRNLRMK